MGTFTSRLTTILSKHLILQSNPLVGARSRDGSGLGDTELTVHLLSHCSIGS